MIKEEPTIVQKVLAQVAASSSEDFFSVKGETRSLHPDASVRGQTSLMLAGSAPGNTSGGTYLKTSNCCLFNLHTVPTHEQKVYPERVPSVSILCRESRWTKQTKGGEKWWWHINRRPTLTSAAFFLGVDGLDARLVAVPRSCRTYKSRLPNPPAAPNLSKSNGEIYGGNRLCVTLFYHD